MTRITLDTEVLNKLTELKQPAEICDASGRVVGRFMPVFDLAEWEALTPEATEEELDRREKAGGKRYTTAEVLAYLEKL